MKELRVRDIFKRLESELGEEQAAFLVTLTKGIDNLLSSNPVLVELSARHVFACFAVLYATGIRTCQGGIVSDDVEVVRESRKVLETMEKIVKILSTPETAEEATLRMATDDVMAALLMEKVGRPQ